MTEACHRCNQYDQRMTALQSEMSYVRKKFSDSMQNAQSVVAELRARIKELESEDVRESTVERQDN